MRLFRKLTQAITSSNEQNCSFPIPSMLSSEISVIQRNNFFIDKNWKLSGVTDQFIDKADTYHDRYFDRLDFLGLVERCLDLAGIDNKKSIRLLDIGSGSGSSAIAAAQLLPNATVFASDISPPLLNKLANFVASHDKLRNRIITCCFDLHKKFFIENSFDLIFGAAILHHLIDPLKALKNVSESLKPLGQIIFVEPLENGSLILGIIFEEILKVLQKLGEDDGELAVFMRALRTDFQARLGVPNVKQWTPLLDDKWVFNESYFHELAKQLHFSKVEVFPGQPDLETIFETSFRSLLMDSGNGNLEIPSEVISAVRYFDQEISHSLKQVLCPTGVIIFTK